MIDPMANLDAGTGPTPGGDSTGGEGSDIFDFPSAQLNIQKMDTVRSFMGIVSGCVAGICGLTGFEGLSTLNRFSFFLSFFLSFYYCASILTHQ